MQTADDSQTQQHVPPTRIASFSSLAHHSAETDLHAIVFINKFSVCTVPVCTSFSFFFLLLFLFIFFTLFFLSWCFTSTETIGTGEWRWGRGRLYTYRYTITTRTTPALRWAAMRAILIFHWLWGTKSQDSVHKPQPFWTETRAKAESSRGPFAYQPKSLTVRPNRLTNLHFFFFFLSFFLLILFLF